MFISPRVPTYFFFFKKNFNFVYLKFHDISDFVQCYLYTVFRFPSDILPYFNKYKYQKNVGIMLY